MFLSISPGIFDRTQNRRNSTPRRNLIILLLKPFSTELNWPSEHLRTSVLFNYTFYDLAGAFRNFRTHHDVGPPQHLCFMTTTLTLRRFYWFIYSIIHCFFTSDSSIPSAKLRKEITGPPTSCYYWIIELYYLVGRACCLWAKVAKHWFGQLVAGAGTKPCS